MNLFHRHKWQIVGTSFTEPREFKFANISVVPETMALLRRMGEGVTHIYLRCEACGDLKELDFYGNFTVTGNDAEVEELRKMLKL